jgi:hypothetical protein
VSLVGQLRTDLDYLRAVYSVELYGNAAGNSSITADLTGGHTTQGIVSGGREGGQVANINYLESRQQLAKGSMQQ